MTAPGIKLIPSGVEKCQLADLGLGAFLGDIDTSPNSTLTSGVYVQKPAKKPLEFAYNDEFKYVLSGELTVKCKVTGHEIHAKAGDVINIAKGADLIFSSATEAKIFFVGNRGAGEL